MTDNAEVAKWVGWSPDQLGSAYDAITRGIILGRHAVMEVPQHLIDNKGVRDMHAFAAEGHLPLHQFVQRLGLPAMIGESMADVGLRFCFRNGTSRLRSFVRECAKEDTLFGLQGLAAAAIVEEAGICQVE